MAINLEKLKAQKREASKRYYANPKKREMHRLWCAKPENRERRRKAGKKFELKSRYGLTVAEFDAMQTAQGNACAICHISFIKALRSIYVDHNHETGKTRALLCRTCNLMLGNAKENIDTLRFAADYLEHFQESI